MAARIVLLSGDGLCAIAIAATVGKSVLTVRRWRRRYATKGVDGLLKDATRPPRRKPLTAETINQVVHMTLHETPPNATHWSLRRMATASGLSHSSVQRIWQAHGLKPHLIATFKLSRDKTSPTRLPTWSGSISIRRTRRWCCASTRRARSRRSIAPSLACP